MPGSGCARCDAPVDPLRCSAIVEGGRVISVCSSCRDGGEPRAREPVFLPEHEPWRRCRCARPIAPGAAHTIVVGDSVELRCGHCDDLDPAAPPTPIAAFAPAEARRLPRYRIAGAAVALLGLGAVSAFAATGSPQTERVTLAMSSPSPLAASFVDATPRETPNLAPRPAARDEPTVDDADSGESDVAEIDDIELGPPGDSEAGRVELGPAGDVDVGDLESLADWTHPLAGANTTVPTAPSRRFGASRPGSRPSECGAGHCGVDLGGPIGAPVVSVRAGVVVRVEQRGSGRSGRYVRVRHSGGVITWYMHLHEVAAGLEVGTPVKAGQLLGSLGKSGIRSSHPHLHFSVQVPAIGTTMRYLDPEPMLRSADVIDPLDVFEPLGDLEL